MINNQSISELLYTFAKEDSKEALILFLEKQADLIYRVIRRTVFNLSDTEDVLQSVFLIILTKAKNIKYLDQLNDELVIRWCITISRNAALMKNREESNRRKREEQVSMKDETSFDQGNGNIDTDNNLIQKVSQAIDKLPENYRLPIHLHYVENLELKQIAKILKLNPNTLRTNLKRGLSKLSVILKSAGTVTAGTLLISTLNNIPLEAASKELVDRTILKTMNYKGKLSSRLIKTSPAKLPIYITTPMILTAILLTAIILIFSYLGKGVLANKVQALGIESLNSESLKSKSQKPESLKMFEWDFSKGIPTDLSLFLGKWKKEDSKDYISFEKSKSQVILLPIKKRKYPIVIEGELTPEEFSKLEIAKNDSSTGLVFNAIVHNNQKKYVAKSFLRNDYVFNSQSEVKSKMYLSSDWTYIETNGKFSDITQYKDIFEGYILIVIRNYKLKKLKIYEIEKIPDGITDKANDMIKNNKGVDHITLENIKRIEF